ncbi:uncharacterized protein LOC143554352 [Bidens hawaiensis]|uniref:uncharacterized protein LOC143554352 n=1 Tax=Bidens hawaiensis TaxID=980011 RepID=UPI00404A72CB
MTLVFDITQCATQRMSAEEQVARFLHIVGNDMRNRIASLIYRHSRSTTSRCFHRVLRAIISLESHYIQQLKGDIVPKEIQEKKRSYPFFKNCIGAIYGTHVRVKVPNKDAARYRGPKEYPTINEGIASDSRIIKNALSRDDKLVIPTGKYCLVDTWLPHTSSLMTPNMGVRYHLKEYSTRAPENSKELFKLGHASLRNAIERAFEEDRDKDLEEGVLHEVLNGPVEEERHSTRGIGESSTKADQSRNSIANQM